MSRRGRGHGGRDAAPTRRTVIGRHPVRELLRAGAPLHHIWLAADRPTDELLDEIVDRASAAGVPVDHVERERLDDRAEGGVHQGVVASAPPLPTVRVGDLLRRAEAAGEPPLLVAVDQITDPHNLGAIARSAEAVGAHGLLLPGRRAAPVTPTAEKAAAGAFAHLPVAAVTNLVRTLGELHDAGVWSLGLEGEHGSDLASHPLAAEPCVLVIGAEGEGLSRLTRERCDALVSLPMRGHVGSLNASVAAGVALYTVLAARERL